MLKCNRSELAGLVSQPLDSLEELKKVTPHLAGRWETRVVVTLGSSGALAVQGEQTWLAQAPPIQAVSAVGSGDAFLAGLACGLLGIEPLFAIGLVGLSRRVRRSWISAQTV
jgi:fructose-1-phosphate kinase PfkB-like protein